MSDQEAWSELCDLYLSEAEYTRAVFCAEELILHNPHCYFVHQRVADIRYTMGGIENLKMAVSHYSHALKLNSDCMRALFGLLLVCACFMPRYSWLVSTFNLTIDVTWWFTGEFQFSNKPKSACTGKERLWTTHELGS